MASEAKSVPVFEDRPDGQLVYILGASRSGKTTWLKEQIGKARRILVWDAKNEYCYAPGFIRAEKVGDLFRMLSGKHRTGPCKIAYTGPVNQEAFSVFCRLAYVWLQADRGCLVVEELSDVTNVAKAPAGWGEICRKSLAFGPAIFAISQRPQEADKSVFGNASMIHCHMLNTADDLEYVARKIGVPVEAMPREKYRYIQKIPGETDFQTGKTRKK